MIGFLLFFTAFLGAPPGPNGLATVPGAVSGATAQQLCAPTFRTTTIRPPSSVTDKLKFRLMDEAGIPRSQSRDYELDHLISLEIGGAPADPNNLWLEPYDSPLGARQKDRLENLLHKLVCNGSITLDEAQHEISTDWVGAYRKRIGALP